jgi:hypothetical protein
MPATVDAPTPNAHEPTRGWIGSSSGSIPHADLRGRDLGAVLGVALAERRCPVR